MSDFLEDIAAPISDDAPSGEDIAKLEPSPQNEEWIQNYANLRGLVNRVATNREEIVELSQSILANKSKDLRVAGHLCLGLLHQKGLAGIALGLKIYRVLVEEYWDKGLYPQKDSVRVNNLKLLDKRLSEDLTARTGDKKFFIPTAPGDASALEDMKETLAAIESIISGKDPSSPISLDNLNRAVAERMKETGPAVKKPQPESEKAPPEKRGLFRRAAPTREAVEEAKSEAEPAEEQPAAGVEFAGEMQAAKAVIQAARFFLEKNMRNPVSYRLLRSSLWYLLPLPNPEPNKEGKKITPIPFPAGKSKLERLLEGEDWESLIKECETVFVEKIEIGGGGCFCLDVQRFLSTALKEMARKLEEGGNTRDKDAYEAINKIILQETAMLVERLPWITDLLYSNGTPFADNQTKRWIDKSVKTVFGASSNALQSQNVGVPAGESSSDGDSQISEEFKKAVELLDRDKWGEAIDLMQKGIDSDPTRRGRFQRRLNLAQLCLSAVHPDMACVLLEQLDTEVERFSLDEWEPSLCLQVWTHLSRCYRQMLSKKGQQENNGFYQEKADRIFEKICRLDIRAAALAPNAG